MPGGLRRLCLVLASLAAALGLMLLIPRPGGEDASSRDTAGPSAGSDAGQSAASSGLSATAASENSASAGWVGSTGCRSCHEEFYQLWATSHHGLAMQPYGDAFAARRLAIQGDAIAIGEYRYRAEVGAGQGWVLEDGSTGTRRLMMVHVLGGKNVYYFLTPGDRGRLQTLPIGFDVRRREWFDISASSLRHFELPIREQAVHWTEREYTFNSSCYSCHVSQLTTNYDSLTDSYATRWGEPGINCETCHGLADDHVRLFEELDGRTTISDPRIVTVTRSRGYSAEQVDSSCAPCHAQMTPITARFPPGGRFFDHYDLIALEDPDFYPDGRDLGENYTYTLWRMSPCVKAGGMDCMHCHTSSGRFRFVDEPNRACLPCHAERVADVLAHSRHVAGSTGSVCIACHMPKTEFARMVRSDHSLLPPTPAATLKYQSPNACNLCHTDQEAKWADEWVRRWHERDYQAPVLHRAGLIDAARRQDWSRLQAMLDFLQSQACDEVYAVSLIRLLRHCDDTRQRPVLMGLLEHTSPWVRSAAAEALGRYISGEVLPGLLAATRDSYRLVRIQTTAGLASWPRQGLNAEDREAVETATAEFVAAMQARPDDGQSHQRLGNYFLQRGEPQRAVDCFAMAAKLGPYDVAPLVNGSLALNALGRNDEAEQHLRQALKIDPGSAEVQFNLGLLLAELGRREEAEQALHAALAADPKLAPAAYNLGVMLSERDVAEAIRWCRLAADLRPEEPRYAYTLAYYQQMSGANDGSVATLAALLDRHPTYADAYALLVQNHLSAGRIDQAIAVCERGAACAELADEARAGLARQAAELRSR